MAVKDYYIKKADCNKCKYSEGIIEDKVSCSVFRDLEETVVQCSAFEEETANSNSNPKPQYKVKVSYTVPQNSLDMIIEAHSKEEAESIAISIFKQSISVKADADNV